MENCIFCKIINKEIPSYKIFENPDFFAFLDINPINLGHILLIPKTHYRNLLDMPTGLLEKLGPVLQKLALAVKEGVKADGINIGWNNESAAGQLVDHAHLHIIPRFNGDGFESWHGQDDKTKADFEKAQTKIISKL
jgi:histidine triad (HIT) family protein